MPRLNAAALKTDEDMDILGTGAFQFSGATMDKLSELSSEFTLVTLAVDVSYSVESVIGELQHMVREVITVAKKDPNSDKILIRLLTFSNDVTEVLGFKPSNEIDVNDINLSVTGSTALYQAVEDGVRATESYAKVLYDQDFIVNSLIITLTDGYENCSRTSTELTVKKAFDDLRAKREELESMISVIIGTPMNTAVEDFAKNVGITESIDAGDFDVGVIKRIGNFVSKSISAQSKAIGSGGPSQVISF